jgi:hypothetical protein
MFDPVGLDEGLATCQALTQMLAGEYKRDVVDVVVVVPGKRILVG